MTKLAKKSLDGGSGNSNGMKPESTNLVSRKSLIETLRKGPQARSRLVESHLDKAIAFQLRSLREAKDWGQHDLANRVGMNQNAVSRLENPFYGKATLTTLKRLAAAFDVALVCRFVPFSELVNWVSGTPYIENGLNPGTVDVPNFDEEEKEGRFTAEVKGLPALDQKQNGLQLRVKNGARRHSAGRKKNISRQSE